MNRTATAYLLVGFSFVAAAAAQHDMHHDAVNARGEKQMGFSQSATTHHFVLTNDGGRVEVTAKDASDRVSIEHIQMHLGMIARQFAAGDFSSPMFIHDRIPPGVPTMKKLKSKISYSAENTPAGAVLTIRSADAKAQSAIHDFLRFQIADHQTGDSGKVE